MFVIFCSPQDEITEMKRKLKIMNHQIDQLKEEISSKEAALVKELGNSFERLLPELVRDAASGITDTRFRQTLADTVLLAPSFTLRGGTREIMRGVIARGLGLR